MQKPRLPAITSCTHISKVGRVQILVHDPSADIRQCAPRPLVGLACTRVLEHCRSRGDHEEHPSHDGRQPQPGSYVGRVGLARPVEGLELAARWHWKTAFEARPISSIRSIGGSKQRFVSYGKN